jgi:glycosyltransferase involved in cell wall biosynthesis
MGDEKTMKVVEVVNIPWWNAAAEYCISVANALSNRGHNVIVICEKDTPAYQKAMELGLEVEPVLSFKPVGFISDLLTIKRMFRTIYNDIQIVNVHTATSQSLFVIAKKLFNLRYKMIRTRIDLRRIKHYPLNKLSYKNMDGFIVTNKNDRDELLLFTHLPENRVRIIHAGVDTDKFKKYKNVPELKIKFGIKPEAYVVGNIARRSTVKGHDVFFKSAQIIHNEIKDVIFVTAGVDDTISVEDLTEMAKKAGVLEKTRILGYVDRVEELINCFDVGVVSSVGSEKHSRITLEYMACGVPVVGSDIGNIPELVRDGETGFIVKPKDFVGMADAVIRLLKDKELREVFGYNARKLVEQKFSIKSFAEITELFYMEVIARKK